MTKAFLPTLILIMMFTLPGCEVIGGIFKAGVWIGVLAVIGIIALIAWLVSRGRR